MTELKMPERHPDCCWGLTDAFFWFDEMVFHKDGCLERLYIDSNDELCNDRGTLRDEIQAVYKEWVEKKIEDILLLGDKHD